MAALNERDERWIVQERADGANCNNWHWTFKDVTARTKAALDERLKAVEFPPGLEGCRITSCTATGECSFSNRKGRLFLTYELDVTLGLTVEPSGGGGDAIEASLRFPDVSATEIDDLQCVLSVKTSRALVVDEEDSELESRGSPTAIPAAVRAQAVPFLTQRLRQEVLALQEELRAEHAEHAPPTVRRSRLQPFPGLAPFRAWRLGVCGWLPALTTLSPLRRPAPHRSTRPCRSLYHSRSRWTTLKPTRPPRRHRRCQRTPSKVPLRAAGVRSRRGRRRRQWHMARGAKGGRRWIQRPRGGMARRTRRARRIRCRRHCARPWLSCSGWLSSWASLRACCA